METGGASVWRVGRTREYRVGSNVRKRISEPEEEIHALGLTPDLYEPLDGYPASLGFPPLCTESMSYVYTHAIIAIT